MDIIRGTNITHVTRYMSATTNTTNLQPQHPKQFN